MAAGLQVVWFKRDLRIADHRPLAAAAAAGPVLPLYVVEPAAWRESDASGRQWAFARESLVELRAALAALGQPLVVRVGAVVPVLAELHAAHGLAAIHAHEETGNARSYARDRAVRAWARDRAIPVHETDQAGVQRGLTTRDGWARRWDRFMAEAITDPPAALPPIAVAPGAIPAWPDESLADDACPARQPGGRAAGRALLTGFLASRGRAYHKEMSSPVTAFDACSRLSPHFAWGTVAMREAAQACWAAQAGAKPPWRAALKAFNARLHWRGHFMQKLEDAPSMEWANLQPAADTLVRRDTADDPRLKAWQAGMTGVPFVDACMRALAAHGWINFRMRAMLMAFAAYHLWLHWRRPGLHLARLFTDYEPGIHWPQCQMQAGTTGINSLRIYNPVKQGQDHDPDGTFTRRWVPELAGVPTAHLHSPWRAPEAGRWLGDAYPWPIVAPQDAARAAKRAMTALRRDPAARAEADAIQARHGSRRSGLAQTGGSGGQRAARRGEAGQAAFDFDADAG